MAKRRLNKKQLDQLKIILAGLIFFILLCIPGVAH